MVVIINGAPGVGKTKTAKLLFETTNNSAFIDGDWVLETNPDDRKTYRHLRYKNIATLAKNYSEAGFLNIFVSFVYTRPEDLLEQTNLLKDLEPVFIFSLIPSEEVLRRRHAEDNYKRVDIETSVKLNSQINDLEKVEKIDNSSLSPEQVADIIKAKINI